VFALLEYQKANPKFEILTALKFNKTSCNASCTKIYIKICITTLLPWASERFTENGDHLCWSSAAVPDNRRLLERI